LVLRGSLGQGPGFPFASGVPGFPGTMPEVLLRLRIP